MLLFAIKWQNNFVFLGHYCSPRKTQFYLYSERLTHTKQHSEYATELFQLAVALVLRKAVLHFLPLLVSCISFSFFPFHFLIKSVSIFYILLLRICVYLFFLSSQTGLSSNSNLNLDLPLVRPEIIPFRISFLSLNFLITYFFSIFYNGR